MSMTEEELHQKTAELEQREAAFRADRLRFELGNALHTLNVRPEALADATALLAASCNAEFGEDGRVRTVRVGTDAFESVAAAATAFLAQRTYLAGAKQKDAPPTPPTPTVALGEGFLAAPPLSGPNAIATQLPKGTVTELLAQGYSGLDLANEGWAKAPK